MNSIKCPDCGLVNFATAPECKRCHLSFQSETAPPDAQYQSTAYSNGNYTNDQFGNNQYRNPQYNGADHYWPQGSEPPNKPIFSGVILILTVFLGLVGVIFIIQQAFHPLDPSAAKGIGALIGIPAILLALIAHFWAIVRIFEQSVGWGLASLFIPLVFLAAVGQFWEKTKRSFVGQMVCVGIFVAGFAIGL